MGRLVRSSLIWLSCVAALISALTLEATPPDIRWNADKQQFSANVQGQPLLDVLAQMAAKTGWHIFVEPDSNPPVNTEFKDVAVGRGIELLVGKLNYALVPQRGAPSKLFVFQTTREHATLQVQKPEEVPQAKVIPNELIVTVKPGTDIEALAKKLGAKVVGHIEGTDTYRLRFEDEESTEKARASLASNEDVTGVENNYLVKHPTSPQSASQSYPPPPKLTLNPPKGDGIVVGVVDTGVQRFGSEWDQFLLDSKSIAGKSDLPTDHLTHGTAMWETMLESLAACSGGGTSVKFLPVDIFGPNANSSSFDVAAGIATAVNSGADIVNLSLGSYGGASYLQDVIQQASQKGIVLVGSAGNEPVTNPVYPAAYSGVLAVTATDGNRLAPYANRGSFVDLAGPGSSVVYFNGQPQVVNGTSPAAAYISGMIACVAERQGIPLNEAAAIVSQQYGVRLGSTP